MLFLANEPTWEYCFENKTAGREVQCYGTRLKFLSRRIALCWLFNLLGLYPFRYKLYIKTLESTISVCDVKDNMAIIYFLSASDNDNGCVTQMNFKIY